MCSIRVLIVEDHPEVSKRIAARLALEADITVAGKARGGEEAIKLAKEVNPDLILIDPITGNNDGMSVLGNILLACPSAGIVVLTSIADAAMKVELAKLGISRILEKGVDSDVLVDVLREMCNRN